jgi:hypothetical protein
LAGVPPALVVVIKVVAATGLAIAAALVYSRIAGWL